MPLRAFDGVFAQVHGSGSPDTVALHGWGRRGADFDAVLTGLDALAVDLPGFGATPPPDEPMGAAGYAARIEPLVEGLGVPVRVLGHSFGGRVAVTLAAARPELVAGLVLTGVPLLRLAAPRAPSLRYRVVRAANRLGVVPDERMERLRRTRGSADYRAATGVMRDVLVTVVNESYERELAAIACPVEMIWGGDDTEATPAVAEAACRLLEEAGAPVTLEVIPGIGHMTPLAVPDRLRAAIERIPR
jgi:pimeloyl-ACP methyl ester carboxylesterase